MATSWFTYLNTGGSPSDPLHYNIVSSTPTCNHGTTMCAIFAEVQLVGSPTVARPYITGDLSAEIHSALQHNQPTPNVKLKL